MTQDQYDQGQGPGYVQGDVATDDETQEYPSEQSKPMTRFQKVASALRGGGTDRDAEQDEADQDQPVTGSPVTGSSASSSSASSSSVTDPSVAGPEATATGSEAGAPSPEAVAGNPPWVTERDEAAMANSPISQEAPAPGAAGADAPPPDYWDEPGGAGQDEAVAVTRPDTFGTTGNGTTAAPGAAPGAATIADVPAGETAGQDAATTPDRALRPGQAAGALGDFSDLTYGNLIPDAAHYTEQWQQIQFRFVDDPQASVSEAADIVAQVTTKMEAAIQERQRAIEERQRAIAEQQRSLRGRWGEGANADTEALRETLRMYKAFLDQLIGPRG